MKKAFLLLFAVTCSLNSLSQKKEKFQYYSFSISPIGMYSTRSITVSAFSADITFKKSNNYFKLFILGGDDIFDYNFGNSIEESDAEYTLMYGKKVFDKKVKLTFYTGIGYYKYYVTIPEKIPGSYSGGLLGSYKYKNVDYSQDTIGFSLQTRIRYIFRNNFSLGLQLHTNLNSINNVFSMGIVLEWIRKKKKN